MMLLQVGYLERCIFIPGLINSIDLVIGPIEMIKGHWVIIFFINTRILFCKKLRIRAFT